MGFRIALAILHMGRIKLGSNVLGAAKVAINQSVNYANERKQFGALISSFGSIKYKLAEQVIKTFTTESAVYRASRNVDQQAEANLSECSKEMALITAYAQFAVEAAILKVFGSESLDYVVDEAVQILGGMGYSSEMPVERGYRDSRINRIFEGTNEINRILVVDTLLKRGAKKDFDLFGKAKSLADSMEKIFDESPASDDYYEKKQFYIDNFKKTALILIDILSETYQRKLVFEQELINHLSNIIMNVYVSESTMLRVQKLEGLKSTEEVALYKDILDVNMFDASALIRKNALDILNSTDDVKDFDKLHKVVDHLTNIEGVNTRNARRRIAEKLIDDNAYKF
jgi:hypothetical protein